MTRALWLFLTIVIGSCTGLALTYASVHRAPDFGAVRVGSWIIRPGIGSTTADPYSKALMSARGEVPVAASEGVALVATTDSSGRPLRATCDYTLSGLVPSSNYWTLTVHDRSGRPLNAAVRTAYTSSEALISEQGVLTMALSADPQPGNWLPLTGGARFEVHLRLYDTQFSTSSGALDGAQVPSIRQDVCR